MKKQYIPCIKEFMNFNTVNSVVEGFCTPIEKYPISKINYDKKYLAFANEICSDYVKSIVENFEIEAWEPIFLNPNYYLIDGQHRLAAAKKMGIKYMDVVIIKNN